MLAAVAAIPAVPTLPAVPIVLVLTEVGPAAAAPAAVTGGSEQDPHQLLLLSYTAGRWDLLVIPPETDDVTAARLMTTAADPARGLTASGLIQEAELFRIAAEAEAAAWDSTRETVWDSEGGHETATPPRTAPRGPPSTACRFRRQACDRHDGRTGPVRAGAARGA
ncbi:DUF5994 family protein [Streptomyces mirabilis]|uniref:DUF5994 family protein n=1 Tax=Streptomyces mirabilis TaxID=68239 RepID=UPI0036A463B1